MKIINNFKIILVAMAVVSFSAAQFIEVEVTVDDTSLRGDSGQYLTDSLVEQIKSYLLNTQFAPEESDIEMVINIRIIIESIIDQGNDKVIKTQAVITNNLDQQFYAKGVDFPYSPGQSLTFSPIYEPLAGFADYYAYMIIAGELDTYYVLGGTPYYNKAADIATEGQSSIYSRGWDSRWKQSNQIRENVFLREAKLHFYTALDIMFTPKARVKELEEPLALFHEKTMDTASIVGNDRITTVFLTSHAEEIGKMMQLTGMQTQLKEIGEFDLENKEVYNKFIED